MAVKDNSSFLAYRLGLYALTFIIGICSLAYEYTLSKLGSDLLGSSHSQWALIIGFMLMAMGLGADYQRKIPEKYLFYGFFFSEIALSLFGGFGPLALYYIFGEGRAYYMVGQFFFTFSIGFIIGMEVPLLLRLNQKKSNQLKINLAQIFRFDYFGGFLGSILWLFILVNYLETILQVGFSLALINLLGLVIALLVFKEHYQKKKLLWGFLLLITLGHSLAFFYSPKITPFLEQKLFRDQVVYAHSTPYQNMVLTKSKVGNYSFYLNGHLQFNSQDEFIYHEFLVHPVMELAQSPQNILVLGGGDGLAIREVLKYPTVKNIVLVDLDPHVTELAKNHSVFRKINQDSLLNSKTVALPNIGLQWKDGMESFVIPNQNSFSPAKEESFLSLQILNIDAYEFVRNIIGTYDVIILDFPDPHHLELAKLYSLSFYALLKNKLTPGGAIVQQASSPFYARNTFLTIKNTLEKAGFFTIPYQTAVPSFGPWGWVLAFPIRGDLEKDAIEKINNLQFDNSQARYITKDLFQSSLIFSKNYFEQEVKKYNSIINNNVYRAYQESLRKN